MTELAKEDLPEAAFCMGVKLPGASYWIPAAKDEWMQRETQNERQHLGRGHFGVCACLH